MKMVKYIFLTFLALAGLVGCNKESAPQQKEAIRFSSTLTKGLVTGMDDVLEMKVYAEMSLAADEEYETSRDIEYISLLDGERVWRTDKGTSEWNYTNTRYWMNDRTFHFFAVWPYSTGVTLANDGSYQVEFNTSDDAQDDLMASYSTQVIPQNPANYPTVPFKFSHLLSKVRLEIRQDIGTNYFDYFKIKSVQLANIERNGILTTSRFDKRGSWYYDGNTISFTKTYSEPQALEVDRYLGPWGGDGEGLHLLPQSFTAGEIFLMIEYDYQQNGKNESTAEVEAKTVRTYLPAGEWLPGYTYTYKITLSEDNLIVFKNIGVALWGEPIPGGAIIIK